MNKTYSKNERAEKICGKRKIGFIILDFPVELGYQCPKNKRHNLQWSEYNYFIWCEQCNYDYPSSLCLEDKGKATEIFLDILESYKGVLK